MSPENDDSAPVTQRPPPERDPVRRTVLALVALAAFVFAYSVLADRLTPGTSTAYVTAYLVRMAPEVSGRIVEVPVVDNEYVERGALLFRIDPRPYEIAVARAEAGLASAGQTVGANTAAVRTAEARVASAIANLENVREQAGRIQELVRKGVFPKARDDQAIATLKDAEAQLNAANSERERAQQLMGPAGADQPQIRLAAEALREAELNLLRTRITAPGGGLVTNLQAALGQYATAGQGLMTFIQTRAVWVQAELRENSLEYIHRGTPAEIVFDALPGRVFDAHVTSVAWGIGGTTQIDAATGLPIPKPGSPVVRFPVQLILDQDKIPSNLRYGSQATINFYTGQSGITDFIGKIWIRIVSVLTYIY